MLRHLANVCRVFVFELRIFGILVFLTPLATAAGGEMAPTFDGPDVKRSRIDIQMVKVAGGLSEPTDMQFLPDQPDTMVITQKEGILTWRTLGAKNPDEGGDLARLEVETKSEEGLLGLAFHPRFATNRKVYLNYVVKVGGTATTRIAEWRLPAKKNLRGVKLEFVKTLLEVPQPYTNHKAGQLVFGPDGFLYIGFGDGGSRNDPHKNGQNTKVFLGKMLRIDVDHTEGGKPYAVPGDNPFLGRKGFLPEIWAYGLRNPWRYTFDRASRLIVADVGQDKWEEIDVVTRGGNYGWNIKEGNHCLKGSKCATKEELIDPVYEYSHDEGNCIIGGYVYNGQAVDALKDKYVFSDFGSGRMWAIAIPGDPKGNPVTEPFTLGRWPLQISTYGKDQNGEVYGADFLRGEIFRIGAPPQGAQNSPGTRK